MVQLAPRDLPNEAAKHFQGTPEQRVLLALRLGREALKLYLATLPSGAAPAEAAETLRRNKNRGRRPSPVMEASRR